MKRITDQTRGYGTAADRNRAIKALVKRGFNYFVCYRDTQAEFALLIGNADWVSAGGVYVNR